MYRVISTHKDSLHTVIRAARLKWTVSLLARIYYVGACCRLVWIGFVWICRSQMPTSLHRLQMTLKKQSRWLVQFLLASVVLWCFCGIALHWWQVHVYLMMLSLDTEVTVTNAMIAKTHAPWVFVKNASNIGRVPTTRTLVTSPWEEFEVFWSVCLYACVYVQYVCLLTYLKNHKGPGKSRNCQGNFTWGQGKYWTLDCLHEEQGYHCVIIVLRQLKLIVTHSGVISKARSSLSLVKTLVIDCTA